jgi:ferredoxin
MAQVFFLTTNQRVTVPTGVELRDISKAYPSLPLKFGCTRGECGVCAIKVIHGQNNLTKLSKQECRTLASKKLDTSHRLACQCALNGDVVIA